MSVSGVGSSSSSSTTTGVTNAYSGLKPEDFIKMMVTQLQNQDPMQPASNQELLAQMSQIGQLQSATDLQTTMAAMTQQTQIGSASSLIGKKVQGLDGQGSPLEGVVSSVKVSKDGVNLELDSGSEMALSNVTSIASASTATAAAAA